MGDLFAAVAAAGELTIFAALLGRAAGAALLHGPGPLTMFAPTDAAFGQLPESVRAALHEDAAALEALVLAHLAMGLVVAADLMEQPFVAMAGGQTLAVDTALGIRLHRAYLVRADILADNGVLHIIDSVLL